MEWGLWVGYTCRRNIVKKLIGYQFCMEVTVSKALSSYSQIDFNGVPVKRRKIAHLEEDGGCVWFTVEVVEDVCWRQGDVKFA